MSAIKVARHRTALRRKQLSRPVRLAVEDSIITEATDVFDYGCGLGDDLRLLQERGIRCSGWDPVHRPTPPRTPSAVVNLGYVLNVIEDPAERAHTLQQAWALSRGALVVAARLSIEGPGGHDEEYSDGYITRLGTFQKYYEQGELRAVIEEALTQPPVAAGPGVFYVFRDAGVREAFLAKRLRRVTSAPRIGRSDALYETHKDILRPLLEFVATRGRLPEIDELIEAEPVLSIFGSIKRAFALVKRVTDGNGWIKIRHERTQDLLVYLALARFEDRPQLSRLPRETQLDVRSFFSTYKHACAEADRLLFSAGKLGILDQLCREAGVGKETPSALYVHSSALGHLPPILRIYEGCARRYMGIVDRANIVKLHRDRPAISYLSYPAFDTDPHPSLVGSLIVHLDGPRANYRDYANSENPPILHRKEEFLPSEHPLREKFARLTRQEERWNLFRNPSEIGTRCGWVEVLDREGVKLHGHRLVRKSRGRDQKRS